MISKHINALRPVPAFRRAALMSKQFTQCHQRRRLLGRAPDERRHDSLCTLGSACRVTAACWTVSRTDSGANAIPVPEATHATIAWYEPKLHHANRRQPSFAQPSLQHPAVGASVGKRDH
jgi:hypothetical protein